MSKFTVYTDGSCLGNPGAGGYAAVVIDSETGERSEIFGGEMNTTNNRMELTAALVAVKNFSAGDVVELFTDSNYFKNAFTKGWLANWKRNGWKTSAKTPVLNRDLWIELDKFMTNCTVNFHWVKGHAGNFFNERCDELARNAAKKIQSGFSVPLTSKKIQGENFLPTEKKNFSVEVKPKETASDDELKKIFDRLFPSDKGKKKFSEKKDDTNISLF